MSAPIKPNTLPPNINKVSHIENLSLFDLIVDIRPYNNYSQSHIRNSINICIPTTLLKRSSLDLFSILKLVSIPKHYKDLLLSKISTSSESSNNKLNVLFYDCNSTERKLSPNLIKTITKFNQFPDAFNIYYLDGGFQANSLQPPSPHKRDSLSSASAIDSAASSPTTTNSTFSNNTLESNEDLIEYTSPVPESPLIAVEEDEHCLSGFKLPSATNYKTKFINSIKKNSLNLEEFKDKQPYSQNYHYEFRYPESYTHKNIREFALLPKWLNFVGGSNQELISNLEKKFNKIERSEKLRLNSLVSGFGDEGTKRLQAHGHHNICHTPSSAVCTPNSLCPDCDDISYKMPKGIEYGFKNRYNNIWPYEHSRVKLDTPSEDDYFNGNYIEPGSIIPSKFSYIATQNPLKDTCKDFWKTIRSENIKLIVSLDNSPLVYLKDSKYVSSIEIISTSPSTVVRRINGDVYHFEYKKWPDFGVPDDFDSILSLISIKNTMFESTIKPENNKLIVHCSAGCGRTGVFITIDSLISSISIDREATLNASKDLIYSLVQNQRKQRLSMVQNLDQYIFCYEFLLYYLYKIDECQENVTKPAFSSEARKEVLQTPNVKSETNDSGDYFSGKRCYTNLVRSN